MTDLTQVSNKMLDTETPDPWKRAEQILLGQDTEIEQAVQNELPANEAESVRHLQEGYEARLEEFYQKGVEDAQNGSGTFEQRLEELKGDDENE